MSTGDSATAVQWDVSSADAALGVTVTPIGSGLDANKVAWAWVEIASGQQGNSAWQGAGRV
ncbi:MAG: hypothetical protein RML32_04915, partial [Gammaproteobacteria bacterium]|nr:hypothetical protein [Gammaproteobacteria bacterium]